MQIKAVEGLTASFRILMEFSSYIHTQIVRKLQESTKVFQTTIPLFSSFLRYMSSSCFRRIEIDSCLNSYYITPCYKFYGVYCIACYMLFKCVLFVFFHAKKKENRETRNVVFLHKIHYLVSFSFLFFFF